jgi:hypothetical protein
MARYDTLARGAAALSVALLTSLVDLRSAAA